MPWHVRLVLLGFAAAVGVGAVGGACYGLIRRQVPL